MRPWHRVVLISAGLAGLLTCGGLAWGLRGMPSPQAERLAIEPRVHGVDTGAAYAWVVPTEHGALLVDTGIDPSIAALRELLSELGLTPEDVHTILLTHGHGDHTGGIDAFPNATVYVGAPDLDLVMGRRAPSATMPWMFAMIMDPPAPRVPPTTVEGGDTVQADDRTATAIAVPGHTAGSTAWVVDDLLFSGDALVAAPEGVALLPALLTEDGTAAQRSVRRLGEVSAMAMMDGHAGLTPNPGPAIEAFLGPR